MVEILKVSGGQGSGGLKKNSRINVDKKISKGILYVLQGAPEKKNPRYATHILGSIGVKLAQIRNFSILK